MLKLAIGQMEAWSNQPAILGEGRRDILKKHALVLQSFGTQGAGETLEAVISGAADIGVGMGTVAALRAFAKGAPVRILGELYGRRRHRLVRVRADWPINTKSPTRPRRPPSPIRPTARPATASCSPSAPSSA